MKNVLIFYLISCFIPVAMALDQDDIFRQEQLDNSSVLSLKNSSSPRQEASPCTIQQPIPTTPRTPNYTISYNYFGDTATLTLWREPCTSGTGNAIAIKAQPKTGNPSFCYGSLNVAIIQNGIQISDLFFDPRFCSNLIGTVLVVLDAKYATSDFSPDDAFTFFYTGGSSPVSINIPAAEETQPSISGTLSGYKNFKLTCTNVTTGKVKTFQKSTTTDWSCSGLKIKPGDNVKATINGWAK